MQAIGGIAEGVGSIIGGARLGGEIKRLGGEIEGE